MMNFHESEEAIAELVSELPEEILRGLNMGVALRPDTLYDDNGLVILGQYHVDPMGLGRYVTIYYGSMMECYGWLPAESFRKKLRHVLHHELTHHLESLAGDRTLEVQDEIDRMRYLGPGRRYVLRKKGGA